MRWQAAALIAGLAGSVACPGDGAPEIQGISGGGSRGGGGPATHLVFSAGPGDASAGVTMSAITVAAEDSAGVTVPTFGGTVTIAIAANPAGGTLTGTTSVAAQAGVATFTDLRIDIPGNGYTLRVTAAGLTGVTSAAFNVQ